MFLPIWSLVAIGVLILVLLVLFLYALKLAFKHTEYNKRLFVEVLEKNERIEKLGETLIAMHRKYVR